MHHPTQNTAKDHPILIIEDDPIINHQLADVLSRRGYKVEQSFDGEHGLESAIQAQHQLILLDIALPKKDGLSVLGTLRKVSHTPVIMVSAKGAEQERIQGLTQGADDYIAKPFNTTELLLRIEAILRRANPSPISEQTPSLSYDGLSLDAAKQSAFIHDDQIDLTHTQFKLLWTLLLHRGEVLTKAFLYQTVLNKPVGAYDRSLDMHLSRLRKKLNLVGWNGARLETVHGEGYCLR